MPERRPRVAIVGAGFGGLQAAKALRRAPANVILIDRQNHHCFQPLLYQVATIGRRAAVVKFGRLQLNRFVGWLFWAAVHIYFLIGVRNRFIVAFNWLWTYLTFQRGAQLITEPAPPRNQSPENQL